MFHAKCDMMLHLGDATLGNSCDLDLTMTMTMNLFSNLHYIHIQQNTTFN